MKDIKLSIDVMSGDHGASVTVPASLRALDHFKDLSVILVGDEATINAQLLKHKRGYDKSRVEIHHTTEVVAMDDLPSYALKKLKDSSMRQAINVVKEKRAKACVSAGNTGALMATARFVLKTLPGIDRPALVTMLPSARGHVHVLDLGSNIDSSAKHLLQFATMGSVLVSAIDDIASPTVGLLNIGVEEIKGNEVIKEAAELIKRSNLNYIGFVEGDDIYNGDVDVVVCDGFVGNVALKTSEGLAQMMKKVLKDEFGKNIFRRACMLFALPALLAIQKRLDHRRYNGATLIGLNAPVIKSHGSADAMSFSFAIGEAYREAKKSVPEKIIEQVSLMSEAIEQSSPRTNDQA